MAKVIRFPRRLPYARRYEEKEEIRRLEEDGIIEPIGDLPTEFFTLLSKELFNDLPYKFKISIDTEQRVEDIVDKMKKYLKGLHYIVLARYNLFTRRQHGSESFETGIVSFDGYLI